MGFRVKIAPGIRVGISSRGVRTSVGPRIARVHVGGGRTGFSTGVGPISYYTHIGGRISGNKSTSPDYSMVHYDSEDEDAKYDIHSAIQDVIGHWVYAHLEEFEERKNRVAQQRQVASFEEIFESYKNQELKGISILNFKDRKVAIEKARINAMTKKAEFDASSFEEHSKLQAELDSSWLKRDQGDPNETYSRLTDAFADNDSRAAVVDINDDSSAITVVVLLPGTDVLPKLESEFSVDYIRIEKMRTKTKNRIYQELVASQVLATAVEAFAVGPRLKEISVVAVKARDEDNLESGVDCIAFGTIFKDELEDAFRIFYEEDEVFDTAIDFLPLATRKTWTVNQGEKGVLSALDLASEKDLANLISNLEMADFPHAQESAEHLGVELKTSIDRPKKKKASKKSIQPGDFEAIASSTAAADIDLAVRGMDLALKNGKVTVSDLQENLSLSADEAKKLLKFLQLTEILETHNQDNQFVCAINQVSRSKYLEDIYASVSFREI